MASNELCEIVEELSAIVFKMRNIECVKSENHPGCSSKCELIMSNEKCAYFESRDILNELIRYRGDDSYE